MGRWGGVGAEDGQLGEGSGVLRACYLIPHRQDVASNSALRDSGKVSRKPRRKRSSPFSKWHTSRPSLWCRGFERPVPVHV